MPVQYEAKGSKHALSIIDSTKWTRCSAISESNIGATADSMLFCVSFAVHSVCELYCSIPSWETLEIEDSGPYAE